MGIPGKFIETESFKIHNDNRFANDNW